MPTLLAQIWDSTVHIYSSMHYIMSFFLYKIFYCTKQIMNAITVLNQIKSIYQSLLF